MPNSLMQKPETIRVFGTAGSASAAIRDCVHYRRLGLEGEERLIGAGVYYGAGSSEATLCQGEEVIVVGGGNSAGQAAMHFARYACKVSIVIRGAGLKETLSDYLLQQIASKPHVHVLTQTVIAGVVGDSTLSEVKLKNLATDEVSHVPTRWLFICIGGERQTEWASSVGILRDDAGYILTGPDLDNAGQDASWPPHRAPFYLETNVPGLFAAGDVRHGSIKRCASASCLCFLSGTLRMYARTNSPAIFELLRRQSTRAALMLPPIVWEHR